MFEQRAVVVGGGLSGLIAARVLSDFFEDVLILEKDNELAANMPRKGVPQGSHVHGLQPHALNLLNHYYPGIESDLVSAGAVRLDFGASVKSYLANGWQPPRKSGVSGLSMTRPLLEGMARKHTLKASNIRTEWQTRVLALRYSGHAVAGVTCQDSEGETHDCDAALVIDASGRGTRLGKWLAAGGFPAPRVSAIHVDVRYATALYERPAGSGSEIGYVVRHYPMDKLGAALLPVENDQWLLSLSGRFGVYPGKDHASFMASAESLPVPEVAELLKDRPATTPVSAYTFSHNELRHYGDGHPAGVFPIGDSVVALNPLYGQGMTSALAQGHLLHQSLSATANGLFDAETLKARHLPAIADFSAGPWKRAVLGDTIFSEASGDIPLELAEWRAEEARLNELAASDPEIAGLIFQVAQFAQPPSRLTALLEGQHESTGPAGP